MFWHVSKGFKAAVKNRHVDLIEYIIKELEMSLDHEAFQKYLHLFLFGCQEAEIEENEEGIETNRKILRLLVEGKGKEGIDEGDNVNNSTPLMVACETLFDLECVKILVEGGADVNAVNNDNMLPLLLIKERKEKTPDDARLQAIFEYLVGRGAKLHWRDSNRDDF